MAAPVFPPRHRSGSNFVSVAILYHIDPDLSIANLIIVPSAGVAEMAFERTERGNEDAGGGFLADAAAAPPLFERPFLQRPFPAEDMPEAGAPRRGNAADGADRIPYRPARRLDPRARPRAIGTRRMLAEAQMRQVEGAQRVELGEGETGAEILTGMPHRCGDRAAPLHRRQRVDRAIRPRRPAGGIRHCLAQLLDLAMTKPLRGRASFLRDGVDDGVICPHCLPFLLHDTNNT